MKNKRTGIEIRQEYLLPIHIRILGYFLLIFGSLGFIAGIWVLLAAGVLDWLVWLSPILAIIGALIALSHYRLIINPDDKTYTLQTKMPGFSQGSPEKFNFISKIYINPVTEVTTYTTRSAMRHDIRKQLFKAFMKLDNGDKIHLDTDADEDKLRDRVNIYIQQMGSAYSPEE